MRGSRLRTPIISGVPGPPAPEDSEDAITREIQNWIDAGTNRTFKASFSTWDRLQVADSPPLNARQLDQAIAPCPLIPLAFTGSVNPATGQLGDPPHFGLYRATTTGATRREFVIITPESAARLVRASLLLHVTVTVPSPGTDLFALWEFPNESLTSVTNAWDHLTDLCRLRELDPRSFETIVDQAADGTLYPEYRNPAELVEYFDGLTDSQQHAHRLAWSVYQ